MSIVKDEADHSTMLTLDSSLKLIGLNIAGESNACSRSSMGAFRFCQLFFFGNRQILSTMYYRMARAPFFYVWDMQVIMHFC
jgi:hypothetical protein